MQLSPLTDQGESMKNGPSDAGRHPVRHVLLAGLVLAAACSSGDADFGAGEAHEVTIRGHDYAFEFVEPVPAGTVRFGFDNIGEVPHEAVLVNLREGVTAEDVSRALQGESDPRELMAGIVGILIADPGESALGILEVELEAGRTYALLCNFTDTDDAPPHIALGMMRVFQVT
jgi:hypothetical protein